MKIEEIVPQSCNYYAMKKWTVFNPPGRVFAPFWSENGFGPESGTVFEGTTGLYERIHPFNSKCVRMDFHCRVIFQCMKCRA